MTDPNNHIQTVTIASGASLSGAADFTAFSVNKDNYRLFGIIMPSSWTAASITFQVSFDNVLFNDFYDINGNEVTVYASSSKAFYLDPVIFASIPYIKVRSGTSAAPVNQAADRTIGLVARCV